MKKDSQLFQSYKKKKMKYDEKLNCDIEKLDVLFNLVMKYFIPLNPEQFNFCLIGSKIIVNSNLKSYTLKLELDSKCTDPEKEAIFLLENSHSGMSGSGKAKKVLLIIKDSIKNLEK